MKLRADSKETDLILKKFNASIFLETDFSTS